MELYSLIFRGCIVRPAARDADAEVNALLDGVLAQPVPDTWLPTGHDRTLYLDLAEHVVRIAAEWVDERGAVIDPVDGAEHGQTSPRFAAPAAVLLASGRVQDLRDTVLRCMDWSCMRLATGQANSPDFWMREIMTAYRALEGIVDHDRASTWANHIRSIDPEVINVFVERDGKRKEDLHNWTVYAAAGESMREAAGLRHTDANVMSGHAFFDKYMPAQMWRFTKHGMYRDPGDPLTYDMTTRLQFAVALAAGYDGPMRDQIDSQLRRGAIAQLFYVSPRGYAPFGGRSSQMHFQEAILAAVCEYEARRYASVDPRLAGAFKRQAHRAATSVHRWLIDMHPMRQVKNGFDPDTRHGCDGYAKLSVYSLFAASCFALAAAFADDTIDEAPCPAEYGKYVMHLDPAFHKLFVTCEGTQVAIDTRADHHHDATGIGRFTRDGVPIEFALGLPLTDTPHYALADEYRPTMPIAIGPEWCVDGEWTRLAALSEGLATTVSCSTDAALGAATNVEPPTEDSVRWIITYTHEATGLVITEDCTLSSGQLHYRATATVDGRPAESIRLIVPLLDTDGQRATDLDTSNVASGVVGITAPDGHYTVHFNPAWAGTLAAHSVGNRNALYRTLMITAEGNTIEATLVLEAAAASG